VRDWRFVPIDGILCHPGKSAMPTRNVVLTDHQAEMIEELVESGAYQNASEVLREGLRLLEERRAEHRAKLKALREAARVGIAAIAAGDYEEFDTAQGVRGHFAERARAIVGRRKR
jgi:antitoxin ParD1/3/4